MKTKTFLTALLIISTINMYSQIINVPGDQPTIQAGINAATDSDTVLVGEGTWFENINFKGKAITVASNYIMNGDTSYINNTIINGSQPQHVDSASVVIFISGEDTTSVLSGFTITDGTGMYLSSLYPRMGGGVLCYNAGAKLTNNKIVNNTASNLSYPTGGGIGFIAGSTNNWIIMRNNIISNNSVIADQEETFGGGIYILGSARIDNNIIENNYCHLLSSEGEIQGGGIYAESSTTNPLDTLFVSYNIISNNVIEGGDYIVGAGIACGDFLHCPASYIKYNTFSNNSVISAGVGYGSAISLTKIYGDLVIESNIIKDNTVVSEGGGGTVIFINQPFSKVLILNNLISDNLATSSIDWAWAAGIWLWDAESTLVVVDGNTIRNNSGNRAGGFYARNSNNFHLTNNIFTGNTVDFGGGAIHLFQYYGKNETDNYNDEISNTIYNPNQPKPGSIHPLIANNTFADNHVGLDGGAIYLTATYDSLCPVIMNNIFWENQVSAGFGKDIHHGGEEYLAINNNDIDTNFIYGQWEGGDNIFEDPMFIAPENDDFHIDNNSPCAGKGIDSLEVNETMYFCPSIDFEDDPRPMPYTLKPDMGADEIDETTEIPIFQIPNSNIRLSNYPNPFHTQTTIKLTIQQPGFVNLSILDFTGIKIQTIISQQLSVATHQFDWRAEGLPVGIYFLRVEANEISETRKLILLR